MSVLEWIINLLSGRHDESCCCPQCGHTNIVTCTKKKIPDHYWCTTCGSRVAFNAHDGLGNTRGSRR